MTRNRNSMIFSTHSIGSLALSALTLLGCNGAADDGLDSTAELVSEAKQDLYVASKKVWSSPSISICWENTGFDAEKNLVITALTNSWEAYSSIRFTGYGNCTSSSKGLRVRMQDAGGYTTGLGKDLNGVQNGVNLNTWGTAAAPKACASGFSRDDCIMSTAVHEIGHALGVAHEQNRPDTPASCTQPAQGSNGDTTVGAWDANSVMNYCNNVRNGRGVLSTTDIAGAIQFYGNKGRLADSRLLNPSLYLALYGDLRNAFGSDTNAATTHWLTYGVREGRRASREIDAPYYLSQYGDLRRAFVKDSNAEALLHWINFGISEGRRGSREFDLGYYLNYYGDLKAAFGANYSAAYNHWLAYGLTEGRRSSSEFDVGLYVSYYPDLQQAFGTNRAAAFDHWLIYGRSEGRRGI